MSFSFKIVSNWWNQSLTIKRELFVIRQLMIATVNVTNLSTLESFVGQTFPGPVVIQDCVRHWKEDRRNTTKLADFVTSSHIVRASPEVGPCRIPLIWSLQILLFYAPKPYDLSLVSEERPC